MSTRSRVKKLEKVFAQIDLARGWMPPGWDVDKEIDRAEAELETTEKLVADEDKSKLVLQYIDKHFVDLLDTLEMPADRDGYKKMRVPPLRRYPRVIRRLMEHTPPDLRSAMVSEDSLGLVKPPFAGHPPTCWLHYWVMNLADLDCRLPPDLKPQTMGAVLEVFLHQFDQMDTSTEVCTACGLRLPTHKSPPYNEWRLLPGKTPMVGDPPWYDLPEFFRGCPHCGTKDMMWRHRTREFQYPWRTLAVAELDSVD